MLILVLVMIVISALIVVPTLQYAATVLKTNTVVVEKTKRQEAVKAGIRVALADPSRLYEHCANRHRRRHRRADRRRTADRRRARVDDLRSARSGERAAVR